MPRLVRDRYVAFDDVHGCDLVTGDDVRLDALPPDRPQEDFTALVELLDEGQDGRPRWVVLDARNGAQAAAMARRAAATGRVRGLVPMLVPLYERLRDVLADDLDERTLLLIGGAGGGLSAARAALVDAAARTPRPHLLLTFRTGGTVHEGCVVREARAAYGPRPLRTPPRVRAMPPEVARHVERAARAAEFQQEGRHAAAERLLRDVAGALGRREAWDASARVMLTLGRLLLERGRVSAAEKVFAEAAGLAKPVDEQLALDGRLWQAIARTDAGRLTDAESVCRAVLLTPTLPASRRSWAGAVLVRVLLWQGRADEAVRGPVPPGAGTMWDDDAVIAASIEATAIRALLAVGDVFEAGQRARLLLDVSSSAPDPIARVVALTAHLRVLAEAGDLHLAEQAVQAACALTRQCRTPWRAARVRLIWHDALRRAGRARDTQRELHRLARLRRVAPPVLRRAIESRLAAGDTPSRATEAPGQRAPEAPIAALVHLAQEEESDEQAVERVLQRAAGDLRPCRVELVSADAGPMTVLIAVGTGLATHLAERVLETGIVLRLDAPAGAHEIGVPVRFAGRLLAALVCRWPPDREPPPHAADRLTLVAAIVSPRVETLIAGRRELARASASMPELIGVSGAIAEVRRAIERAARAPFAVMIEGESGVGKELAARAIHQLGARRERRFCDVNCAALPDELLESELFGHAKGAFTGAVADKAGLFEEADGGTLFLDEVPDLSPRGQAKLLRVVQQQEVRRIGETFTRKIDVRLVAATSRDLRAEAASTRFRADLLFRLDVIHVRIPPLRERPEDVPVLARHFWRAAADRVGSRATLTHGVLAALARYPWPGNVRELQNVMAALAVAAPARGRVHPSLLAPAITGAAVVSTPRLADARSQFERRCVEVALARAGGSRTRAAIELGISRQGLLKTMARLGIGTPGGGAGGGADVATRADGPVL